MRRRLSIGNKLYLSVLSLFFIFAIAFIVFQQNREKQYKIATLDLRLQDFNDMLHENLTVKKSNSDIMITDSVAMDSFFVASVKDYLQLHSLSDLRVTIILKDGRVLYDNVNHDYENMSNHSKRPEVIQALSTGSGSAVERNSSTMGRDYFYSASYYPKDGYIVRSALPYNVDLAKDLQTDQHYVWFAVIIMLLLTIVLYRFIHTLGRNITKLNEFAGKIADGQSVPSSELGDDLGLGSFSNDELGDTAERLVKMYIKLQRTQQQQNILKRQLTQNVAHELKTPVASIQGYLETILENPKVDDEMRKMFLQRCYAQSNRLTSLLADMSMLNRIDDGASMMTFENVDVAEIINTVESECQLALEKKDMTMTVDIPEHIDVMGNRSLLYSIFRNLTDNAIAYAGNGKAITLTARPNLQDEKDVEDVSSWAFTFADNGNGVPQEHLPRLFERFYRVDKGRSRKMGGTGLGLAIVKNAVLLHGGKISVKNRVSGGLQFDFTLAANFKI